MEWYVRQTNLVAVVNGIRSIDNGFITIPQFELLTGKCINWAVRIGKYIITLRTNSKIKIYDKAFIVGSYYKFNKKIYKCEHITTIGTALLTPRGNALTAITAENTKDWEIK